MATRNLLIFHFCVKMAIYKPQTYGVAFLKARAYSQTGRFGPIPASRDKRTLLGDALSSRDFGQKHQ